jgi:hypothetical protein
LITELGRTTSELFYDDPRMDELQKRWMKVIGDHFGEGE